MSKPCAFCGLPVNPYDQQTFKEVTAWVGGPKKDHAAMRSDTGRYAHEHCVKKAKAGQAADQPDIFGSEGQAEGSTVSPGDAGTVLSIDEVLGEGDHGT